MKKNRLKIWFKIGEFSEIKTEEFFLHFYQKIDF